MLNLIFFVIFVILIIIVFTDAPLTSYEIKNLDDYKINPINNTKSRKLFVWIPFTFESKTYWLCKVKVVEQLHEVKSLEFDEYHYCNVWINRKRWLVISLWKL